MGIRGQYKNKRDSNEPEIVEALEGYGFTVVRMDAPVDLAIGKRGITWLAEVKTEGGKFTEAQMRFFENWRGNHLVLRTIQDVTEWVKEIEGR